MKLKYEMSFMDMNGVKAAVPLNSGDGFRGVLKMNETAESIIGLLKEETTEDAIISALLKEYNAPEEKLRMGVRKVLGTLREKGLLDEATEGDGNQL